MGLKGSFLTSSNLMACLLTPIYFKNIFANFSEKIIAKSEYLARTVISLANNKAIWASFAEWIVILNHKELTCTTKALIFSSNAAFANFFWSIISTQQVIDRAFLII